MRRSIFLLASLWGTFGVSPAQAEPEALQTDVLIVGGTESGWAAAIQAARMGVESITVVHDGVWLGGQYTEQALVCVDENKGVGKVGWAPDWHPMKRSFHRSGLFKELMDGIEAFNTEKYGHPMPGFPFHGPTTFRPAEAEAIFRRLLQPYVESGQVRLIWEHYPVEAEVSGDRLTGLAFAPVGGQEPDLRVRAAMTIDASDWGDVVQVSGAAYECGPDPQERYGEPSARPGSEGNPPNEMNPITWPMIVAESEGDTPIPRPPHFDDRYFQRVSRLSREGMGELKWDRPARLGGVLHWPDAGKASPRQLSIYTVRRIVDGEQSKDGKTSILLNYSNGQDYPLERLPQHVVDALEKTEPGASRKNIVELTRAQRDIIFQDAKEHSLRLLYHLQNTVHDRAPDKTHSFRHFHLSEEFGTADHLPFKPYIREALRLKAMYMMREQDGRNRDGKDKTSARERFSHVMYEDGLFAWQFHYDYHNTGRAYLVEEGESGPWMDYEKEGRHTRNVSDRCWFPLRSLIPETLDGLLGAQKNLGYSSIVCAAIRLHDHGVHVGQAAGATAALALSTGRTPRAMTEDRAAIEAIRAALCGGTDAAVPLLLWPWRDLPVEHPAFVAINRLSALGALPIEARQVDFRPDDASTAAWIEEVSAATAQAFGSKPLPAVDFSLPPTRGEYAIAWWGAVRDLAPRPFERKSATDADADGIPDAEDALRFTPNEPIVWAIEERPLDPASDGLPPAAPKAAGEVIQVNFTHSSSSAVKTWSSDHGAPFSEEIGRGWDADLRQNTRHRGGAESSLSGDFVFTRDRARWEQVVQPGRWRVTLCVGDAGHEQYGQQVAVEGQALVNDGATAAGRFEEVSAEIVVGDGRLTVDLGPQDHGGNTCINWLRAERLE
ncbi:MAG: FAD-dependent oxidoreductase [Verrucomicrobiales bacterium]|nr:FAD-dependent oxidoreductase [Verrucomicrobiales bacterium]